MTRRKMNLCLAHLWRSNGRLASISTPLFCPNRFKCRPRLAVAGSNFSEVVLLNCKERFCRNEAVNECRRKRIRNFDFPPFDIWDFYRQIWCHREAIDWTHRVWCPANQGLLWLLPWWPNRVPVEHVNVSLVLAYRTEDHPSQQTLHCLMCIASVRGESDKTKLLFVNEFDTTNVDSYLFHEYITTS